MRDLEVNLDVMQETIRKYSSLITELRETRETLRNHIEELRDEAWVSQAGTVFQEKFSSQWSQDLDKYIASLEHLKNNLVTACKEYGELEEKARKI